MILFERELPDFPGRNPDLDPDQGKEHSVSISVSREQIEFARGDFDIDVEAMVTNTLLQQIYYEIGNQISKACLKKTPVEIEPDELEKKFLKITKSGHGFIILNILLADVVQEYPDFILSPLKSFESFGATLYELGYLNDYKIFVDPNIRFDDPRIAVVTNNFYNFKPTSKLVLVVEGTMAPKTVTRVMMNMKKPRTKVFKVKLGKKYMGLKV